MKPFTKPPRTTISNMQSPLTKLRKTLNKQLKKSKYNEKDFKSNKKPLNNPLETIRTPKPNKPQLSPNGIR